MKRDINDFYPLTKEEAALLTAYYSKRGIANFGGETKSGYTKYEQPDGTIVSIPCHTNKK